MPQVRHVPRNKLKVRDKIDPMERGFLNILEKWAGGRLYHCKFCRDSILGSAKVGPVGSGFSGCETGSENGAGRIADD